MTTTAAILAVCVLAGHPAAAVIPFAARMLLERLRNGRRGRHDPRESDTQPRDSLAPVHVDDSKITIVTI
jgi:hypothetical protein